jgi:signal transduction histidine kinase
MLSRLRRLMTPPVFPDEDTTRVARLLTIVLNASIVLNALNLLSLVLATNEPVAERLAWLTLNFVGFAIQFILLTLIQRGRVRLASHLLCSFAWGILTIALYQPSGVGLLSSGTSQYAFAILSAGLLLGARPALIYMGLSLASITALYFLAVDGVFPDSFENITAGLAWLDYTILFVFMGVLLALAAESIRDALNRAHLGQKMAAERLTQLEIEIAARQAAEKQAMEAAIEKERVELLQQFISGISHDLKNPLGTIDMNLFMARQLSDNPSLHQRLDIIQSQSNLLNRFVQDMLALSKLDHAPELELHPIDLNTLLQEIETQLHSNAEQKNIRTELNLDATLLPVLANHDELYRALVNLVENAINYTQTGGRVVIRTAMNSHNAIAEVQDTGVGIHPDDLPSIFNPFFRADRAKISDKGSGLGLAIVKRIVEIHNGTVEVESQLGEGTTFRVCLPVQNPA